MSETAGSGVDDVLRAAWTRNRPTALARAANLGAAADGDLDDARTQALVVDAHKLAGALGMYGLDAASGVATKIDGLVVAGALGQSSGRAAVAALGRHLVELLEAAS
jgi:hypothetical protein